jgi:hypothetical protein
MLPKPGCGVSNCGLLIAPRFNAEIKFVLVTGFSRNVPGIILAIAGMFSITTPR